MQTNTNGANGTTSDPREQIMWDIYVENLSKGIDNAYKAAIEAKYSEDSARNITMRDWFKERLGKLKRKDMLSNSEKKLARTLEYEVEDKETGKIQTDLLRIQVDVAKTLVSTLGKDEGYSTRSEVTGKDGKDLQINIFDYTKNGSNNPTEL
jgi:hypothetical protein